MEKSIELGIDTDSILGNDPQAIATIDVEASLENYENALLKALSAEFPDADIELVRDNDRSMVAGFEDEEAVRETIAEIDSRIYQAGDFWVTN